MKKTDLVPFDAGGAPAIWGDSYNPADVDSLTDGITGGFAVLSFRGKVWRVKYQQQEHTLLDSKGELRQSLPVVILAANPRMTKTFYVSGYEAGNNAPPDCYSNDGIKPEPSSPHMQNPICATCPHNQFGSKMANGHQRKGKACSDNRRLAVVPAEDLRNEKYGGPILLRVPPASFGSLVEFTNALRHNRLPPYAVVVNLSFDPNAEHPQIVFQPRAVIASGETRDIILEMRNHPSIDGILGGNPTGENAPASPTPAAGQIGGAGAAEATPATMAPKANGKAAPAASPAKKSEAKTAATKAAKKAEPKKAEPKEQPNADMAGLLEGLDDDPAPTPGGGDVEDAEFSAADDDGDGDEDAAPAQGGTDSFDEEGLGDLLASLDS